MNRFSITGEVDLNGTFRITNLREFKDYCNRHKGEKIICTFEAIGTKPIEAHRAYYTNYIVPKFQKILYKTGLTLRLDETDEMLRSMSLHSIRETFRNGHYEKELIPFRELTREQLGFLVDDLKRIAAQEFFEYIE